MWSFNDFTLNLCEICALAEVSAVPPPGMSLHVEAVNIIFNGYIGHGSFSLAKFSVANVK